MSRRKVKRTIPEEVKAKVMTYSSARKAAIALKIPYDTARKLYKGEDVAVRINTMRSIKLHLSTSDVYTFKHRMLCLMASNKARLKFIQIVRAYATLLSNARDILPYTNTMSVYRYSITHSAFYDAIPAMRQINKLLKRIHVKCPEYDKLLFEGTGYLEALEDEANERYIN